MAWSFLRSSYDAVAGEYEARFASELDGKPRDRELLDDLAATVADPVLDLGCGPGQIGGYVQQRGRRVVGADLSAQMARRARARLGAAVAADMRRLPFASSSLGGVVAFYSLIHLPRAELTPVLAEVRRVLRPGGRMLLSAHEGDGTIDRHEFLGADVRFAATLFQLDELTAAGQAAGLDVTKAERRPSYASESGTVRLYVEARRPAP